MDLMFTQTAPLFQNRATRFSRLAVIALTGALMTSCGAQDQSSLTYDEAIFANLPAANTGSIAEIQGIWVSDDNVQRTVTITGSQFQDSDNVAARQPVPIVFVTDCKAGQPDPDGEAFILGSDEQPCYLLSSVSDDKLVYIYEKTGRMHRFGRKAE